MGVAEDHARYCCPEQRQLRPLLQKIIVFDLHKTALGGISTSRFVPTSQKRCSILENTWVTLWYLTSESKNFTSSHEGAKSEALRAKASATVDRANRGNTLSISTRQRSGYRHASARIGDQRAVSPHRASRSMSHSNGINPSSPLTKANGRCQSCREGVMNNKSMG